MMTRCWAQDLTAHNITVRPHASMAGYKGIEGTGWKWRVPTSGNFRVGVRVEGRCRGGPEAHLSVPDPDHCTWSEPRGASATDPDHCTWCLWDLTQVNCVGPGATETPLLVAQVDSEDARKGLMKAIPLQRMAHPDEVGDGGGGGA